MFIKKKSSILPNNSSFFTMYGNQQGGRFGPSSPPGPVASFDVLPLGICIQGQLCMQYSVIYSHYISPGILLTLIKLNLYAGINYIYYLYQVKFFYCSVTLQYFVLSPPKMSGLKEYSFYIQPVSYKRYFRCNNCILLLVYTIHLSLSTKLVDPPPMGTIYMRHPLFLHTTSLIPLP